MNASHPIPGSHRMSHRGFSLIEVTIALGVVAFALVAIIGVLPMGLNSVRHSGSILQADVMARDLISTLRTRPDYQTLLSEFPLPDLTSDSLVLPNTNRVFITENGLVSANPENAAFAAEYTITRDVDSDRILYVHLQLAWPPQGATNSRQSTEITSAVLLP